MRISRRQFGRIALASPALSLSRSAAAPIDPVHKGVVLGVQSYSFRDRSLDDAIAAMKSIGLGLVELWSGHAEPAGLSGAELTKWRLSVPMDHFASVRKKFDDAGIQLYAYNYSFRDSFSDDEIARGFDMARALGVKCLTASANVTTAKRVDAFAAKAGIKVGMHNHSRIVANEFARPEDFEEAMKGMSHIAINLDIGHFTAAGFDAVDFLSKHHAHILTLHIKDRKKDQGPNVPFGEGDTPIKQVLQLLQSRKLTIPANIEYEYGKQGMDHAAEVRRCFEYCKQAL